MRAFTRSFLLFAVILIGAELVTRFVFVRTMEGRFDYGYHPTAGFVDKGDEIELTRAGGRRFFPQTFSKQRPAGVYRVIVIGDSVARGKSVELSYTGQLGKILKEKGIQAECLNLALPGFGARRKDLVLQHAMKFQPNLIILHVGGSNEYEDEREWRRRSDFNSPHPKNWLMTSLVLRQFYEMKTEKIYWQWLPSEVRNHSGVSDANTELLASSDEKTLKEWSDRLEKVTREGAQRLQESHIPLLLVAQATNTKKKDAEGHFILDDSTVEPWLSPMVNDQVARLRMKDVFAPNQVAAMYSDANHIRPDGHRMMAEAIEKILEEKGWISLPAQK